MKIIIFLILIVITTNVYASFGMRKCALLPIKDNTKNGDLAFQVYNKLEYHLKESEWCYYRSNSEILSLLENYRNSLQQYLSNPNVVKIIAEKLKAGSLLKLNINNHLGGVKVDFKIIGENGSDIYYQNKMESNKIDVDTIVDQIIDWLHIYEKNSPYNARVTGVLGNQFTVDGGTAFGFRKSFDIIILRSIKKKKHPLLKEIIDWETIKIGSARIYNTTDSTSQGRVIQYDTRKKIKVGDWVIIAQNQKSIAIEKPIVSRDNFKFGKLGSASIFLQTSFFDTIINSSNTKKLSGVKLGVNIRAEMWITRAYFAGLNFVKSFTSMKQKLGSFSQESQNISNSNFQIFGGYKYLPLGFFYGPQINGYLGYSSYNYGFNTQVSDGLTSFSFGGLLLGINGEVPFMKRFRGKVGMEFIFSPSFFQETNVLTSKDSSSSTNFTIEAIYKYKINLDFNFKYQSITNKALLTGSATSIEFKDSIINLGTSFTF